MVKGVQDNKRNMQKIQEKFDLKQWTVQQNTMIYET